MEIEKADPLPPYHRQGLRLEMIKQSFDPLKVIHAADEEDALMLPCQLLQLESHPPFPAASPPGPVICGRPS